MAREMRVLQGAETPDQNPGARVEVPTHESHEESIERRKRNAELGDVLELSANEVRKLQESYLEHKVERDHGRINRVADAELAHVSALLIPLELARGGVDEKKSWEMIHELRAHELTLDDAIDAAWDRDASELETSHAKKERQSLLEAHEAVQKALQTVSQHVQFMRQRSQEEELKEIEAGWPAAERAADEYQAEQKRKQEEEILTGPIPERPPKQIDMQVAAYEEYEDDLMWLRNLREREAEGRIDDEEREVARERLESRIKELEHIHDELDALPDKEAMEIKNAIAHQTATYVLNELRSVEELLKAEPMEEERIERLIDAVNKMIENVDELYARNGMTEEWHTLSLTELSRSYYDLENRLNALQKLPDLDDAKLMRSLKDEKHRIAESLQSIDETRDTLHRRWYGEENEVQPEKTTEQATTSVEEQEAPKEPRPTEYEIEQQEVARIEERKRKTMDSVRRAMEHELLDLQFQEKDLGSKVEKFYGKSPDEILARGGIGLSGAWKRLIAIGAGEDVFKQWRRVSNRITELDQHLNASDETEKRKYSASAKALARAVVPEVEALRAEQRQAAKKHREATETKLPKTGEELEEEYMGDVVEPAYVEQARERIQQAVDVGIENAPKIFENMIQNPATEFLEFTPDEYINQMRIVAEALTEKVAVKGIRSAEATAIRRRYTAADRVIKDMRRQLREYGIDPRTGGQTKGIGKITRPAEPRHRKTGPLYSGSIKT